MAAVLACGPHAVLSHRSDAALPGLRPDSRPDTDVVTNQADFLRRAEKLIVDLASDSPDPGRAATALVRLLARLARP